MKENSGSWAGIPINSKRSSIRTTTNVLGHAAPAARGAINIRPFAKTSSSRNWSLTSNSLPHENLPRVSVLFPFLALWPALAGEGGDSPASAGTDRAADATVYYHEERRVGRDFSELVQKSPHAYYPSINQLAVCRERLRRLVAEGYRYPSLPISFSNQWRCDNDPPFTGLIEFVAMWKRLGLKPELELTTAGAAVAGLEKEVGATLAEHSGEWKDWWANGMASMPRELAAARRATISRSATLAVQTIWATSR